MPFAALARLASYFLLLAQKKITKEKATPCRYAFKNYALRRFKKLGAAELASLKQSSPLSICRSSRRRGKGI